MINGNYLEDVRRRLDPATEQAFMEIKIEIRKGVDPNPAVITMEQVFTQRGSFALMRVTTEEAKRYAEYEQHAED